jgi:DNA-binding NarL/FixJ family response regulator
MIRVCLIGADIAKEKALLESQSDITVMTVAIADLDQMLDDISRSRSHILVISDVGANFDANDLCLHTYLQQPDTKTLIITEEDADYARLDATGFSCKGFMLHEQRHAIVRAVRVIHDGEAWLSRRLVTAVMDHLASGLLSKLNKPRLVKNN